MIMMDKDAADNLPVGYGFSGVTFEILENKLKIRNLVSVMRVGFVPSLPRTKMDESFMDSI